MSNIVVFQPQHELNAERNLADFITLCRENLDALNARTQFDNDKWDVEGFFHRDKKSHWLNFQRDGLPMTEPMASFAKAFTAYRFNMTGGSITQVSNFLLCLKAMDRACQNAVPTVDFAHITGHVFDMAFGHLTSKGACKRRHATLGFCLKRIAEFLVEHRLVAAPFSWAVPIRHFTPVGVKVGKEGDENRAKKLPSQAAIEAIPQIFHRCNENGNTDNFSKWMSSYCAVLMSNPSRATELLTQPAFMEVEKFSEANSGYGLRWWPKKGGKPIVKPVLEPMIGPVKKALATLRKLSEPARQLAAWYEANPNTMYLPPDAEHLRNSELLTLRDICQIFYGDYDANRGRTASKWLKRSTLVSVPGPNGERKPRHFLFDEVERAVLRTLPRGFPHFSPTRRYSEMLFITLGESLRNKNPDCRVVFSYIDYNQVTGALNLKHGNKTIFSLYGFTEPDGSPIEMTTHQFRHWLNTLAQLSGLSQLDIALWSGRANVSQNAAYNHVTAEQRLELMRSYVGDSGRATGSLAGRSPKVIPISQSEYVVQKIPTAHVTDFGYCPHDFSMAPCQLHRDCLFCSEHICVKGDVAAEQRLDAKLHETRRLLEEARAAVAADEYGADRWVQHQQELVERMRAMMEALRDPSVQDGALIQMTNPNAPSRLKVALENRVRLEVSYPYGKPKDAEENAKYVEDLKVAKSLRLADRGDSAAP